MVEACDRAFADRLRDRVEVFHHAAGRAVLVQGTPDRHLKPVRMPVQARALARMVREKMRGLEPKVLTNLHRTTFEEARSVSLRTNRRELVICAVAGEAAPARLNTGLYDVAHDGRPFVLPSVGGITPNVRVGDGAFAFAADHVEPGVSVRHPDERANLALNAMACVGNEAVVLTGDAKGERGWVTGKHGGVEHVMVDFSEEVMRRMAIGDRIQIWAQGLGTELLDAPEVKVFNASPEFLERWAPELHEGVVRARVARVVPATLMGSGLGRSTVVRGDYDIQSFDDGMADRYGLRELRLGDIVAISDADNSFGRIYRSGAISVGVVVHGRSFIAGHGPGVTTLLTSTAGAIEPIVDAAANLAQILELR